MQKFKNILADCIKRKLDGMSPENGYTTEDIAAMLEYPPDKSMGDVAFPCFKLSKLLRKAPPAIAQEFLEPVAKLPVVAKAEVAGGYLNIFADGKYFTSDVINRILSEGDRYGSNDSGKGKTMVIDYSSPNVAKPFHIGHLGTTVIGHSLKMLYKFCGWNTIGINHLGDWGTQFGKLIVAYRKWGSKEQVEKGGIDELVSLYVRINKAIKEEEEQSIKGLSESEAVGKKHSELGDEARHEFKKLEDGDEENRALWKWFISISIEEYKKTYKQLGIEFDYYTGESFYTDLMPAQVQKLRDKNLLKTDDGASIVDLSAYNMPPCLILKRDGSTLYPTRDIAAAVYRKETYHFDKCIYVTSNQQILHFAQWFKVLELMGYDWYNELLHVPYGTVSINGAKLSTRDGNVILLRDLFKMAIDKSREIIEERNPSLENKDEVAEAVGVGAIVFNYLSNSRIKDINFNLEDALSFDGNTGPYAQYTYARCCSLIEKAGIDTPSVPENYEANEAELQLLKTLSAFSERVEAAIKSSEPMEITRFILDVCSDFNRFYHDCQIISAEDKSTKDFRIALTYATRTALGNAFGLICLKKTQRI